MKIYSPCNWRFASFGQHLPISPHSQPLANIVQLTVTLSSTFLDSAYKWDHMVFVLLVWLMPYSKPSALKANGKISFFSFLWINYIKKVRQISIFIYLCVHAKSLQSCLTLCESVDCSLRGSSVHRILQARLLEWVATPSSRGSSWPKDQTHVSYISCIGRQVLYH